MSGRFVSVLASLLTVSTAVVTRTQPAVEQLRFHHLHVSVGDPAGSMNRAATRIDGTRKILQGHGVGVRKDGEYLIFDRRRFDDGAGAHPSTEAAVLYGEAAEWLRTQGVSVTPADVEATHITAGIPDAPVGAVAFSAPNLPAIVERLEAGGVRPFERNDETARYRLPSGASLEIVAETDRPEDHWCPMHPDIRSAGPSRCTLCGMDLVPIPPPRLGEYRLDLAIEPRAGGGASGLRMAIRDPQSGEPVLRLLDVHERPFHLFILSRDLQQFMHVHPNVHEDGAITLKEPLDPGQYVLIADFLPADGTPQMVQRVVVTPGYTGPLFPDAPALVPSVTERTVDGVRVRLVPGSLAPLRAADLRFELTDEKTGRPVTDLSPYLGASGHLLIVSADVSVAVHGHPEGEGSTGPLIAFNPLLPAPGPYKLWLQFQRGGRVTTVPFVIVVPEW